MADEPIRKPVIELAWKVNTSGLDKANEATDELIVKAKRSGDAIANSLSDAFSKFKELSNHTHQLGDDLGQLTSKTRETGDQMKGSLQTAAGAFSGLHKDTNSLSSVIGELTDKTKAYRQSVSNTGQTIRNLTRDTTSFGKESQNSFDQSTRAAESLRKSTAGFHVGDMFRGVRESAQTSANGFDQVKGKTSETGVAFHSLRDHVSRTRDVLAGTFLGSAISNGVSNLGTAAWNAAKQGIQLAQAGEMTNKQWQQLGLSTNQVKSMGDEVNQIRGVSDIAGSNIKQMQLQFYSLTRSVPDAQKMTETMSAFGTEAGLSGDQIEAMVPRVTRLTSAGKVSATFFQRTFGRVPALKQAVIDASGETQTQFNKVLSAGKLTGSQLQQYLVDAANNSGKAWESYGSTTEGLLSMLKGTLTDVLARSSVRAGTVARSGVKSLSDTLMTKDKNGKTQLSGTGNDLADMMGNAEGTLANAGANLIQGIVKNRNIIEGVIKDIGTVVKGTFETDTTIVEGFVRGFTGAGNSISSHKKKFDMSDVTRGIKNAGNDFRDFFNYVQPVAKPLSEIVGELTRGAWDAFSDTISGINRVLGIMSDKASDNKKPMGNIADLLSDIAKHKHAVEIVGGVVAGIFAVGKVTKFVSSLKDVVAGFDLIKSHAAAAAAVEAATENPTVATTNKATVASEAAKATERSHPILNAILGNTMLGKLFGMGNDAKVATTRLERGKQFTSIFSKGRGLSGIGDLFRGGKALSGKALSVLPSLFEDGGKLSSLGKAGSLVKTVGSKVPLLDVGMSMLPLIGMNHKNAGSRIGQVGGGLAAIGAGMGAGALAGSAAGPVGIIVGAITGLLFPSLGGKIGDWLQKNFHPAKWLESKFKGIHISNPFAKWHPIKDFKSAISGLHPIKWIEDKFKGMHFKNPFAGLHPVKWFEKTISGFHPIKAIENKFKGIHFKNPFSNFHPVKWFEKTLSGFHPIKWIEDKFKGIHFKNPFSSFHPIKWFESKMSGFHPVRWIENAFKGIHIPNPFANWHPIKDAQRIISGLQGKWNGFKSWIGGKWTDFKKSASDTWSDITKPISDSWDNLISGIKDKWNGFKSWFGQKFSWVGSTTKSVESFLSNVGKKASGSHVGSGKHAAGGSIQQNGLSLVGEEGYELLTRHDQHYLIGEQGPQFMQLQAGDQIYSHDKANRMVSNRMRSVRGFAKGTQPAATTITLAVPEMRTAAKAVTKMAPTEIKAPTTGGNTSILSALNRIIALLQGSSRTKSKGVNANIKISKSGVSGNGTSKAKLKQAGLDPNYWQHSLSGWNKTSRKLWNNNQSQTRSATNGINKVSTHNYDSATKDMNSSMRWFSKRNNSEWDSIYGTTKSSTNAIYKQGTNRISDLRSDAVSEMKSLRKQFETISSDMVDFFGDVFKKLGPYARKGMSTAIDNLNGGIKGIDVVIGKFGGNNDVLPTIKYAQGSNGPIDHSQMAVVNDANWGSRQEAIIHPNGTFSMPKGDNVVTRLDAGDTVLNGSVTRQYQDVGLLPHFAHGTGKHLNTDALTSLADKNASHPDLAFHNEFMVNVGSDKGQPQLVKAMQNTAVSAIKSVGIPWTKAMWSLINNQINDGAGGSASGLLAAVEKYGTGHKYVWGATGPDTFDCSGLVQYALKKAFGISYPRTSGAQIAASHHISSSEAKPGDLVGNSEHIGVYAGDGKYFSAESPSAHPNIGMSPVSYFPGTPSFGRVAGIKDTSSKGKSKSSGNRLDALVKKELGSKALKWISDNLGADNADVGQTATPAQARKIILKAMHIAGVSGDSWLDGLETIAQHESNFSNVTNHSDINAQEGHPSSGWFQMIKSTFDAYAKSGFTNSNNPIDQGVSAIGYIKSRYGGIGNVPGLVSMRHGGPYKGYAKGGHINAHETAIVGEKGWEVFTPDHGGTITPHDKSKGLLTKQRNSNVTVPVTVNIQGSASAKDAKKIGETVEKKVAAALSKFFNGNKDELDYGGAY